MFSNRFRPQFERLEDRCVPSVTSRVIAGGLYISGTPLGQLDVLHTGAYTYQVKDNGATVGVFPAVTGGVTITLTKEPGDVKVDLEGNRMLGNLVISLGVGYVGAQTQGNYSVDVYSSVTSANSKILGNVSLLGGNGQEIFNIGAMQTNPGGTLTMDPITVTGTVTVAAAQSNGGQGDAFRLGDGSSVLGSVSLTSVDQVSIGIGLVASLARIGLDLSINDYGSLRHLAVSDMGFVGRNLTVTGTSLDDSFSLETVSGVAHSGEVDGYLNVDLEGGLTAGDSIQLFTGTLVIGNATLTAGDNLVPPDVVGAQGVGDVFAPLGSIDGNLTINMGNGTNTLYFAPQNSIFDQIPFVGGNMIVNAGNNTNYIGTAGLVGGMNTSPVDNNGFDGYVSHNLTFNIGSGDNGSAVDMDPMLITAYVGGTLTWHSGDGQDFLQLGDNATSGNQYNYNVNIVFGNDDDEFALDIGNNTLMNPQGILTGSVNGGGFGTNGNTFDYISGTNLATITNFQNFI